MVSQKGTEIQGYTIIESLGTGTFAEVFKVSKNGEYYALKRYTKPIQGHELPSRVREEFEVNRKWRHPNLARTYEVGMIENERYSEAYLVMDLINGRSLSQIEELPMSQGKALDVILDSALGLAEAAKYNIVHRDIKPGNIMLKTDDTAVVVDFGMARLIDPGWMQSTVHSPGSLSYCSPHQYQYGGQANQGDDIYSLGLVFYYILTGKHAFWVNPNSDGTVGHLRAIVDKGEYIPIRDLNPGVSSEIIEFIDKTLKCDKEKGHLIYTSWEQFFDDICRLFPLSHRRRPNNIHPDGLDSIRLVEYQAVFHKIYSLLNSTRSTEEVMLRLVAASADLLSLLQEATNEMTDTTVGKIGCELASVFTWLIALADRTGVDLETAVWLKYPSVCTYCHRKHETAKIESQCKGEPRPIRPPALMRLAEKHIRLRPTNLEGWENQLREAFPTTFVQGIPFLTNKLIEEIGEVSATLSRPKRRMDLLRDKTIDPLAFEMADLFAWLCHCSHYLGRMTGRTSGSVLGSEIARRFRNEVCFVCSRSPCMCNQELLPNGERLYDMQDKPSYADVEG